MEGRKVSLEDIEVIAPQNICASCACLQTTKEQIKNNLIKWYWFVKKKACPRYENDPYRIYMKLKDWFLTWREDRWKKRINMNRSNFAKLFNAKIVEQNIPYISVSENDIDFQELEDWTITVMWLGKRDLESFKKDEIDRIRKTTSN